MKTVIERVNNKHAARAHVLQMCKSIYQLCNKNFFGLILPEYTITKVSKKFIIKMKVLHDVTVIQTSLFP